MSPLLWLWMGVVYHLVFFRAINPAAVAFGAAFVLQSALLLRYGLGRDRLAFRPRLDDRGVTGGLLLAYALVGCALLGAALGHVCPAASTFGLPCPTTIFTLALLLWIMPPVPWPLLVIPVGSAVVGRSAAVQVGVREDFSLAVAALAVVAFAAAPRIRHRTTGLEPARR